MILKLATLMSVLAFVMASCNNKPAFGEHNENQKEKLELLQIAKGKIIICKKNIVLERKMVNKEQMRTFCVLFFLGKG